MSEIAINQYLTFTLEDEQYAVTVSKVREVIEYTHITKIPKTASFMKGVVNIRGSSVPVIDLRSKFGMEESKDIKSASIIITEIDTREGKIVLGALADSVQEVIELEPSQIEDPPRFGANLNAEFLEGIGKKDDKFVIILDIDKIFDTEDVIQIGKVEAETKAVEGA
jgi:purine-binding chemotaxis protein CheW